MYTRNLTLAAAIAVTIAIAQAASAQVARYGFGAPATTDELAKYFSIPPDGRGLPPGSGNATKGAQVYAGPARLATAKSLRAIRQKESAAIN